jgi:hypothetical protein
MRYNVGKSRTEEAEAINSREQSNPKASGYPQQFMWAWCELLASPRDAPSEHTYALLASAWFEDSFQAKSVRPFKLFILPRCTPKLLCNSAYDRTILNRGGADLRIVFSVIV